MLFPLFRSSLALPHARKINLLVGALAVNAYAMGALVRAATEFCMIHTKFLRIYRVYGMQTNLISRIFSTRSRDLRNTARGVEVVYSSISAFLSGVLLLMIRRL